MQKIIGLDGWVEGPTILNLLFITIPTTSIWTSLVLTNPAQKVLYEKPPATNCKKQIQLISSRASLQGRSPQGRIECAYISNASKKGKETGNTKGA